MALSKNDGKFALSKDDLRHIMKEKRNALKKEELSIISKLISTSLEEEITKHLLKYENCVVAVYLPSSKEINILSFIEFLLEKKIKVVSPKWNGNTYDLAVLKSLNETDLVFGPMHILEPAQQNTINPAEVTFWVVPGLAFTNEGKRIGYGGGWYDRLLCNSSQSSLKIGVACKFQVLEDFDTDEHDIILNKIIAY